MPPTGLVTHRLLTTPGVSICTHFTQLRLRGSPFAGCEIPRARESFCSGSSRNFQPLTKETRENCDFARVLPRLGQGCSAAQCGVPSPQPTGRLLGARKFAAPFGSCQTNVSASAKNPFDNDQAREQGQMLCVCYHSGIRRCFYQKNVCARRASRQNNVTAPW